MAFTSKARGNIILHTDLNQYAQYFAGTNVQEVARAGNSTSVYADSVRQTDTTNGYISRLGYGTSGAPTWMADFTKTSSLLRNFLTRGFKTYDVEAFGDTSNASADHTTIINTAIQAIRDERTNGNGDAGGAILRFQRTTYNVSSINATELDSVMFEGLGGPSTTHFNGSFQLTTSRAIWDLTGSNACILKNIIVTGVVAAGSYVATGAGFLIAPTGTSIADSNKNEFIGCGSTGFFNKSAVELIIGTDNTFISCAFQNASTSKPTLHAGLYNRYSIGSAYATISTVGNSWAAASQFGENSFFQCEFHDTNNIAVVAPSTPTDSAKSTIELDNAQAVRFYGGNCSNHSPSNGSFVRLYGNNQHITFDGMQFYRDYTTLDSSQGGTSDSRLRNVQQVFWMSGGPSGSQWITRGLAIRNCSMIGIPDTATHAGIANTMVLYGDANCLLYDPDIRNLGEAVSSVFQGLETSGVLAIKQANSTSAATDTILGGHIDCAGLGITAGGSIGAGTVIARCSGAPTLQSGGHDYSLNVRTVGVAVPGGTAATSGSLGLFFNQRSDVGFYSPAANTGAGVVNSVEQFRWSTAGLQPRRIAASGFTTALQPSDLGSLSGTWGATATVNLVAGHQWAGWFQVNSVGGGEGPNPTVVLTYPDGGYATAPSVVGFWIGGASGTPAGIVLASPGTATCTFQLSGFTPAGGNTTYRIGFIVIG